MTIQLSESNTAAQHFISNLYRCLCDTDAAFSSRTFTPSTPVSCPEQAKSKGRQLGSYFESWMGSIRDERGGSSLRFELPLDDLSTVDTRWVRRLVLRCLEMLYYQERWEKLVDIALRFSALSK